MRRAAVAAAAVEVLVRTLSEYCVHFYCCRIDCTDLSDNLPLPSLPYSCSDDDDDLDSDDSEPNSENADDDDDEGEDENDHPYDAEDRSKTDQPSFHPLQLVWAKTRGYPWYPALIMDPDIPKGFVNNGVPLPMPPTHVLEMRKRAANGPLFLILFFDAKRTWQWLPPTKLEMLGIEKSFDQSKLVESRKPQEKKEVKKAYQDALHYQSQVTEAEQLAG